MNTPHTPDGIAPPFSAYSHGMEAGPDARWLYVSGQVGIRPDGTTPEGMAAQCEQTWKNVEAILASAGMTVADIVRINGYITDPQGFGAYREARDAAMQGHKPASTLIAVAALAAPDWAVEIEVVAAQAK